MNKIAVFAVQTLIVVVGLIICFAAYSYYFPYNSRVERRFIAPPSPRASAPKATLDRQVFTTDGPNECRISCWGKKGKSNFDLAPGTPECHDWQKANAPQVCASVR